MRALPSILIPALAISGITLKSTTASAQADVNPLPPNVLLLVDSSSSMEYKVGTNPEALPTCEPGNYEKSRWIQVLEVLTGGIRDYGCLPADRSTIGFARMYADYTRWTEASAGDPPPPYDATEEKPYHRPLFNHQPASDPTLVGCFPVPGDKADLLSSDPTLGPTAYAPGMIRFRREVSPDVYQDCTESTAWQDPGLLDTFASRIRFGLMTFDTFPDPDLGMPGTWSYFFPTSKVGWPAYCADHDRPMEVGARNVQAPPWEGRMVTFGPHSNASGPINQETDYLVAHSEEIQRILLATRPFGATPLAGMLDDARDYLWHDTEIDDTYGPHNDPYLNSPSAQCRANAIILLTDGEPNLDLRPFCDAEVTDPADAGHCPYDPIADIAADLRSGGGGAHFEVPVYVVGFSMKEVTLADGSTLDCDDPLLLDRCNEAVDPSDPTKILNRDLNACCVLNEIAQVGGGRNAIFASTASELQKALNDIFSSIAASTASRTLPVLSAPGEGGGAGFQGGFRFYSYLTPTPGGVWSGLVERQRWLCDSTSRQAEPQDIDVEQGDDFSYNLNHSDPNLRRILTYLPDSTTVRSRISVRPDASAAAPDGLGNYGASSGEILDPATVEQFVAAVPDAALFPDPELPANSPCGTASKAECSTRVLRWTLGLEDDQDNTRCADFGTGACTVFGGVYHSTPRLVGRPSAAVEDVTYDAFATEFGARPLMLYTSTVDGQLHAFRVGGSATEDLVNTPANNEAWAFIPPGVLPRLYTGYDVHAVLLDGQPVVQDVVARLDSGRYRFERDPENPGGGTWRTILVQAFGAGGSGFFALDITDPILGTDSGPRFLWQLTTDGEEGPLFGATSAPPLITTLFFASEANTEPTEVAVAILPGGAAQPTAGDCPGPIEDESTLDVVDAGEPRAYVHCYGDTPARSVTIVRLDNGEVIRSFRRAADAPAGLDSRVIMDSSDHYASLTSPITSQAAVYPAGPGAIADRAYVGDQDGIIWRLDLSATNPRNWTMNVAWDAFHPSDDETLPADMVAAGRPIELPPVISTDEEGHITIAFATGDQDSVVEENGAKNYVYSLYEAVTKQGPADDPYFVTTVDSNWYKEFLNGERVVGPLNLFNRYFYFTVLTPPSGSSTDACLVGTSQVCGMHYRLRQGYENETEVEKSVGGSGFFEEGTTSTVQCYAPDGDGNVFGVTVAQVPSCADISDPAETFVSGVQHISVTNVTPARYQLVMHLSGGSNTDASGTPPVETVDLPTPDTRPFVLGWAALLE